MAQQGSAQHVDVNVCVFEPEVDDVRILPQQVQKHLRGRERERESALLTTQSPLWIFFFAVMKVKNGQITFFWMHLFDEIKGYPIHLKY